MTTALQAIRECRSCVELIAKVTGALDEKAEDENLVALADLIDQVRAHGGDMPRGSCVLPDMVDITPPEDGVDS